MHDFIPIFNTPERIILCTSHLEHEKGKEDHSNFAKSEARQVHKDMSAYTHSIIVEGNHKVTIHLRANLQFTHYKGIYIEMWEYIHI